MLFVYFTPFSERIYVVVEFFSVNIQQAPNPSIFGLTQFCKKLCYRLKKTTSDSLNLEKMYIFIFFFSKIFKFIKVCTFDDKKEKVLYKRAGMLVIGVFDFICCKFLKQSSCLNLFVQ